MTHNRYGTGPSITPSKRLFTIQAKAFVDTEIFARTADEAEDAYNGFREAVTGSFYGLYLDDAVIFESETDDV